MTFYVNIDHPTRVATVHRKDCRHTRFNWPSYPSIEEALFFGVEGSIRGAWPCGVCLSNVRVACIAIRQGEGSAVW